jgi:hypothetical protein
MAQWYGRYDTSDNNKILEAGFVDATERARWDAIANMDVTVGFDSDIPNDLMNFDATPNYRYNASTEEIESLS